LYIIRRIVTADIHGNYKALKECIKKSKFNYDKDELICLGDTCDGYQGVKECFNELLKIKNLKYIIGNHDLWALQWFKGDEIYRFNSLWTSQGGINTILSYDDDSKNVPKSHIRLLEKAYNYYIDDYNNLFVHGGYDWNKKIEKQDLNYLIWDRSLCREAYSVQNYHSKHGHKLKKFGKYNYIFVGHTTTELYKSTTPLTLSNVIMVDTGAGFRGKLTFMDIDTKEYWQSSTGEKYYGK